MNFTLQDIAGKIPQLRRQGGQQDNPLILTLAHDSRKVEPGTLFVCIPGATVDGHDFAEAAVRKGAVAVLAERPLPVSLPVPVLLTPDVRKALEVISAWFFGEPARQLRMIGVTGTNGKTTTTHIIRDIFNRAGLPCGVIGTLHTLIGDQVIPVKNTTPDVLDLQSSLAAMVAGGMSAVAMEVSSHALALGRVTGCEFDTAVFTNMTQDHLDFHGDLTAYRDAKANLFRLLDATDALKPNKNAIVNIDDPAGRFMLEQTLARPVTYGIEQAADLQAVDIGIRPEGCRFRVVGKFGEFVVQSRLTGRFNVYNLLAAIGVALAEGISVADIQAALASFSNVPGRFERVEIDKPFSVIVDYAHTPDGLENVLRTAKQFVTGRLIAVFGCGGDRDRTKRPIMGELATRYADRVIVTSDNPRSENPDFIIGQIMAGIVTPEAQRRTETIADRRQAIQRAMEIAEAGDVILVAGKGHENYQILADRTIHFDDREVVQELAGGKS
jgi:UDP-N-acetylmuramoyl-L-alanyl-D-glutamate--2,6-diaminopimelate ligase/murE/murF fusion protein